MDVSTAFDEFQDNVSADPAAVKEARERRDKFLSAFDGEGDVEDSFTSGSLRRRTQIEPINDVDLVVIFSAEDWLEWGEPGGSAEDALGEVQGRVNSLLGSNGSADQIVRQANVRNHAVKCFLDDPDDENAFTVDVAPALTAEGQVVRIPEVDSKDWIRTDPRHLIDEVDGRASWSHFRPLVRCLKRWGKDQPTKLKSLLMEVLALQHLREQSRPNALSEFFTAASAAIYAPVVDPADECGEIQTDLDPNAAAECLGEAADLAARACAAEEAGEADRAICLWHELFGEEFPEPEGGCEDSGGSSAAGAAGAAAVTTPSVTGRRPLKENIGG